MVENLNGGGSYSNFATESPSSNPKLRGLHHRLQFETVPIEDRTWDQVSFPDEVKDVPLDILRAAVKGDVDAYGDIYEIYQGRVLHYFQKRVDIDWAEDCAQDLWARVYNKLPRYEFVGIPFHNYLFAVANHISIDWWRKQRHEDPLPDADFDFFARLRRRFDSPEEVVELKETVLELQGYLSSLKPDQIAAVVGHSLEGLSHAETARIMGKTEDAVKQLHFRGMRFLKRVVVENGHN